MGHLLLGDLRVEFELMKFEYFRKQSALDRVTLHLADSNIALKRRKSIPIEEGCDPSIRVDESPFHLRLRAGIAELRYLVAISEV